MFEKTKNKLTEAGNGLSHGTIYGKYMSGFLEVTFITPMCYL